MYYNTERRLSELKAQTETKHPPQIFWCKTDQKSDEKSLISAYMARVHLYIQSQP